MGRVVIIGSGLAGLSCAHALAERGISSWLVSPQRSERAASVLAEGGINAALDVMGEGDTWQQHFEDTMSAGRWLADARSVAGLCHGAPDVVRSLIGLGVPFQTEGGSLVQRPFGGQRKKRTTFVGSSTGKMLVTALVDAVRRHEAAGLVERLAHHELVQLAIDGGACRGAWVRDVRTGELSGLMGPVVLASGSYGGLFGPRTTGSATNTGDVAAIALAQGVELANLEFIQYHPTTIPISGKRLLVSEAARGEGGRLFVTRDGERWYFMEELYPELGNLMPRDVVSREEVRQLADPANDGHIYLDMTGLSQAVWESRLHDLRDELIRYVGADPATTPVEVEPGIHYCMGGILVDEGHATNVAGLFAAGECACAYHGANRLGGNSLLGAIYGGARAAASVVELDLDGFADVSGDAPGDGFSRGSADAEVALDAEIAEAAFSALGVVRDEATLEQGVKTIEDVAGRAGTARTRRRAQLALASLGCALGRRESRGAHTRSDYPETLDDYRRTSVVRLSQGKLAYELRAIASSVDDVSLDEWEVRA